MPLREQNEERNPEFVNRPRDRPSSRRHRRDMRRLERKISRNPTSSGSKFENLTYSTTPIKKAALNKAVQMAQKERQQARAEGQKYANEVLGRKYEGLAPDERTYLENQYAQDLERDLSGQSREFANRLGRKSRIAGIQNAHQADLANQRQRGKLEYRGALDQLNRDIAMKKQAAAFAIESGEAAQSAIDRQQALENARHQQQHVIQRRASKKLNRAFNRI